MELINFASDEILESMQSSYNEILCCILLY